MVVSSEAIFLYLLIFILQRLSSWSRGFYETFKFELKEKKQKTKTKPHTTNTTLIYAESDSINLKTLEKQITKKWRSVFWSFK